MSKHIKVEKLEAHLASLYLKKKDLDSRIEVLYAERVNDEYVNNLKLQKVKLNDEIVKLKRQIETVTN